MREFLRRHRLLISYVLFGILSTVLSLGACYLTLKIGVRFWHDEEGNPLGRLDVLASTVQWVVGVLVAFATNKRYVFKNESREKGETLRQLLVFSGSRVGTYFLEVVTNLGVILLLDTLSYRAFELPLVFFSITISSRVWAKLVSSVLVVFTNYFISKLLVFRQRNGESDT